MYRKRSIWGLWGTAPLLTLLACGAERPNAVNLASTSQGVTLAPSRALNVKFFSAANKSLPPSILQSVAGQSELISTRDIALLSAPGASPGVQELKAWQRIELTETANVQAVVNQLRKLDNVRYVRIDDNAPLDPASGDYTGNQTYQDLPPTGLGSRELWSLQGGLGAGITVFDIEHNWHHAHEDLASVDATDILLPSDDTLPTADEAGFQLNGNHGAAAIGIIGGDANTFGITGMAREADLKMVPQYTVTNGYRRAEAILRAADNGKPGDVILMEMQTNSTCGEDLGPTEWEQDAYEAVVEAVQRGFVVVAAGGNGDVDLDQPDCGGVFDRAVRDSGAIIVGSGLSGSLAKTASSSYGARIDVHAWGENVTTLGYGDLYADPLAPANRDVWYTSSFGGTSSASALVAGAVAQLQGIIVQRYGVPFNSFQMRDLLVRTGDAQDAADEAASGRVGPRVNLTAAADRLRGVDAQLDIMFLVDMTGSYRDDLPNFQVNIVDIVNEVSNAHDDVRFGLATFQDFPIQPFGWPGGGFTEQDGTVTNVPADYVYRLDQSLTGTRSDFLDSVQALTPPHPGHGQDGPEAQLPALYQLATGEGITVDGYTLPAGQNAQFRDGAVKLILVWTDNSFHLPSDAGGTYPGGIDFNDVAQAIFELDPPQVMGLSSDGGGYGDLAQISTLTSSFAPASGIDCDADGVIDVAPGEPSVCVLFRDTNTNVTPSTTEAILALVGAGVQNRQVDVGVTLDLASPPPRYLRVGEQATIQLNVRVTNHGPSSAGDARLDLAVTGSEAISATVSELSQDVQGLAVGTTTSIAKTVTVSCSGAGAANIALEGRVRLTAPVDSFDGMPVNDTARLTFAVECLPSIYASRRLDVRNYASVEAASVYGGNDFRLGTDAVLAGNVFVNGDVTLWSRARIEGDVRYAGLVTRQDGVVVTGSEVVQTHFENILLPVEPVALGTQNRTVGNNATATWLPGNYRDGIVRARGKVRLQAGEYHFKSLQFEPDSGLELDTSVGPISIKVDGALQFGDRMKVLGGSPMTARFYSNTTGTVRFGTDLTFAGSVVVPSGSIHVYSRTTLTGNLWAKFITLEPRVVITD
jgi:serine protease